MPLLWIPQGKSPHYAAAMLHDSISYVVRALADRNIEVRTGGQPEPGSANTVTIRASNLAGNSTTLWCLYCARPGAVRVSSVPVLTTLSVLRHKDMVTMPGGGHFYFSSENLAQIVPFPGSAQPTICPRCRRPIEAGTPAVQCPRCRIWYHQTDDYQCYSYADSCAGCQGRTTLEPTFQWVPGQV